MLHEKGARKFAFLSLAPLGCMPILKALNLDTSKGGCFEEGSAIAQAHNKALKIVLASLEYLLQGFKYCDSNFYDWCLERINYPAENGTSASCSLTTVGCRRDSLQR